MNVLIVFAHPEPRSLGRALRDIAVAQLIAEGHEVRITDLYAEGWKAQVDRADFPGLDSEARLRVGAASGEAFDTGGLAPDILVEQDKLLWADVLILQFPFWWFSMPAILKGWVDRVFTTGFASGVGEFTATRWSDRFGEGKLAGKRAMLVVTAGGWPEHYGARAINGPIDDLLFPINHGILFYPGYEVLPSYVTYRADRLDAAGFEAAAAGLRDRMATLATTTPLAYRSQNGGDYLIPSLELRAEIEPVDVGGFGVHLIP